jgi:hypothetical protein
MLVGRRARLFVANTALSLVWLVVAWRLMPVQPARARPFGLGFSAPAAPWCDRRRTAGGNRISASVACKRPADHADSRLVTWPPHHQAEHHGTAIDHFHHDDEDAVSGACVTTAKKAKPCDGDQRGGDGRRRQHDDCPHQRHYLERAQNAAGCAAQATSQIGNERAIRA